MCEICTDITYGLSIRQRIQLSKDLKIEDVITQAIDQLYNDRKIDNATQASLFQTHFEPLKKAVEEGYNVKIEYGTPNYEFLKQLQTNTAVFAMFKSHASAKEMASKLKDDQGNLRSKEEFKQEALKVDATYRTTYLDTEYDTAVRQARMAANWQKYQRNKRLYPNLTYIQSKAANPRPEHLAYVGITRPIDDPFWQAHYPPVGWKCQCSVEPTDDEANDVPDGLPEVPKEFAFNSGITGQVFDLKNNNYIKSVPPKEQPALIKQAEKFINTDVAAKAEYQPMYKSKSGGTIEAHPLAFDNNDFNVVLKEARSYVNQTGKSIKILPDVQDPALRKQLLADGAKGNKSPDFLINNAYVADLKVVSKSTRTAIREAIKRCYQQCNNILLKIDDNNTISSQEVYRYTKGALTTGFSKMDKVSVYYGGKWYDTSREEILKGNWPVKDNSR
jgi:ribosomal protein L23